MRRLLLILGALVALTSAPALAAKAFIPYEAAKFDTLVKSGAPVVALVHADWCPTCRQQMTLLNELFNDPKFAKFEPVRVDYDKDVAFQKANKVTSRSTILVYKGGKEVSRLQWETDKAKIRAALETAL